MSYLTGVAQEAIRAADAFTTLFWPVVLRGHYRSVMARIWVDSEERKTVVEMLLPKDADLGEVSNVMSENGYVRDARYVPPIFTKEVPADVWERAGTH